MKKFFCKRFVSLTIILIIVLECFSLTAFASNNKEVYTYTDSSGKSIEYYIDEDGHEYINENGEKMFILLPLEKYRTSNSELIDTQGTNLKEYSFSPITNTTTRGYVIISTLFNSVVYFSSGVVTGYKSFPGNADYLRIKTTSCTPWTANNNINVHLYVKSRDDGSLYDYHYFNQSCSITKGFSLSGRFAAQVNVGIVAVGNMTSCNLAVTATEG